MIVVNFSHPFTTEQLEQLSALLGGKAVDRVIDCPIHWDPACSFWEQAMATVAGIPLSTEEWQSVPFLLNLPGLSAAAAALVAEISGRCGFLPAIVRMAPIAGATPPRFAVVEIVNLHYVRECSRARRSNYYANPA